jgi:hypothetical protein
MRAHHAGQRTLVGYCQGFITQLSRLGDQLLGMGSTAQKGEVANAMEFGVTHKRQKRSSSKQTV